MTYISQSSNFALYLEKYLTYKHQTYILGVNMTQSCPKIKCMSLRPIFQGPVILPYMLKSIWCTKIMLMDNESVWPEVWPKSKCRSQWPTFCSPVYHGEYLMCKHQRTSYGSWVSIYDPKFDTKTNVGHSDLYFLLQWFSLYFEEYRSMMY